MFSPKFKYSAILKGGSYLLLNSKEREFIWSKTFVAYFVGFCLKRTSLLWFGSWSQWVLKHWLEVEWSGDLCSPPFLISFHCVSSYFKNMAGLQKNLVVDLQCLTSGSMAISMSFCGIDLFHTIVSGYYYISFL